MSDGERADRAEREVARLRAVLTLIQHRTCQPSLNRLAREALGVEDNPLTVELLAELRRERDTAVIHSPGDASHAAPPSPAASARPRKEGSG